MADTPFGKIKYKDRHGQWVGYAPLPAFAAHGTLAADEPVTEENAAEVVQDLNQALDNMKQMLREKFGDQADAAFAAMDAEHEKAFELDLDEDDPKEIERDRRRAEKAARRATKIAAGKFPFSVSTNDGAEPSECQAAAFRFLIENEAAVADAVLNEVWTSFQEAYSQEYWRKMADLKPAASLDELRGKFAFTSLSVTPEHRGGFSHLVFRLESSWQDEHGLMVVYSPDTREAAWTSYDGLDDLTPTDEPVGEGDGEEYVETPHDELVNAIFNGEDDRAKELIAAGADINAVDPDQLPPLCLAVEHLEVENVRRLLAFGADPRIADAETGRTPLKMAKRTYREMGFAPSKKKPDPLVESMMEMVKGAAGPQFAEMKQRLDDIIAVLEAAERA